jgi:hypothetical protein
MAQTQTILVKGAEEKEVTKERRTGRFLFFFETEWWETISERHIGNDIHIATDKEIRNVYLNGELINPPHQP